MAGQKGIIMTNTRFNKLWDLLHKNKSVEFTDHGEKLILLMSTNRYGADIVLRVLNGNWNTVCVSCDKEEFRYIHVD